MAMDPDLVAQLNNAHARGIAASGTFAEQNSNVITQLSYNIAVGAAFDTRLMNGFLASQLFNESAMEAKTAYHTPVEPAAAPLPATPAH